LVGGAGTRIFGSWARCCSQHHLYGGDVLKVDETHAAIYKRRSRFGIGLEVLRRVTSPAENRIWIDPSRRYGDDRFGALLAIHGSPLPPCSCFFASWIFGRIFHRAINALIQHRPDEQHKAR